MKISTRSSLVNGRTRPLSRGIYANWLQTISPVLLGATLLTLASADLSVVSAAPEAARSKPVVAPTPAVTLALVGAQVFLPSGASAPGGAAASEGALPKDIASSALRPVTILVAGERIVAIGPEVVVPSGVSTLDLKGKFVTPGLIDVSSQLGLVEVGAEGASVDTESHGDPFQPAFRVEDGFNARSIHIPIARRGGVTSVIVSPVAGMMAGYSALASLGAIDESRQAQLVQSPIAQHWRLDAGSLEEPFASRNQAWMQLREVLSDAQDYAKRKPDFEANRARPYQLSRIHLEALQPVLQGKVPLVVTVHRASDIENVVRLGEEWGLKLVLAGASEAWLVRDLLVAKKIPVILDPIENLPDTFDELRVRSDQATLLHQAGVTVLFSTFSAHNSRLVWQRASNAVRYGMDYDAALRAITENPAQVFGLKDIGRIAPGSFADLVVWSGVPLELSSTVEQLFIRGKRASLESRQTLLLERYRQVPPTLSTRPRAEGGR